jgi:2-succinyl-6-hydroxy-2,4-cyclohexadiene-1-carboxylate synthase
MNYNTGLSVMTRYAIDDIQLNVESGGDGEPLILLHGFMGSAQSWNAQWDDFTTSYHVHAVDLPGHGYSDCPSNPSRYFMDRVGYKLLRLFDHLLIDKAHVLGYSMGGRVALYLAVKYPDRIRSLTLESASPGIESSSERQARIASDDAMAQRLEEQGLSAFVDYWTNLPLFESQRHLPQHQRIMLYSQRLQNNVTGLSASLRGLSTGRQPSLWSDIASLYIPTLLITGEYDEKYVNIAQRMMERLPTAKHKSVPNAGHTVHLEQPAEFTQLVLSFLREHHND